MGTNFTNSQSQFIYNSIKNLFPTITQGDVDDALGTLSITEQGKQNLIDQGIVPFQQNLISLLKAVENDLDGGVILASTGIERRQPQLRDAECVLFDVGIALLGVSALLTDGVSAAVVYGFDITWSQIFGASAVIGGIFSKYARC